MQNANTPHTSGSRLRKTTHAVLMLVGFVPWVLAMVMMWAVMWFARAQEWVLPNAKRQNCWTYALPKFQKSGGYLLVRYASGVQMLGIKFPHVEWVKTLPTAGIELEYFHPDARRKGWVWPCALAYYPGHVRTVERPQNARRHTGSIG